MEPTGLKSFSADQPEGSEGRGRDTIVAVAIVACVVAGWKWVKILRAWGKKLRLRFTLTLFAFYFYFLVAGTSRRRFEQAGPDQPIKNPWELQIMVLHYFKVGTA